MRSVLWLALILIAFEVHPASFESLLSPGTLSQAHAEFDDDCSQCHKNFNQEGQTQLCIDCHEEIGDDLSKQTSFHGLHPDIAESTCRSCHTEHEGRDKDITGLVPETFDHDLTNFPLVGPHAQADCGSCHEEPGVFRGTPDTCYACHAEDDAHDGQLGEDCASCHEPKAVWDGALFDHDQDTEFALAGAHQEQSCSSCHVNNRFEDTSTECVDCHKLDDVHNGDQGDDCGRCHNPARWEQSDFDHNTNTDFELIGSHASLTCSQCHLDNMALAEPPTTCIGCHSADDVHLGTRGDSCNDCHNNESWSLAFEHEAETGFALAGAHAELQCESCHVTDLAAELPTSCEKCHEEDDPHDGSLGACDSCHNTSAWSDKIIFDHEFTNFPLVGLHQLATCDQCHLSQVFNDVVDTCIDCHRNDDKHEGSFGTACDDCHNPGGWDIWTFDHDQQTTFALLGAHEDLICASCHSTERGLAENLSSECINCHLADDQHDGQFGSDCARCHTTETFKDGVRFR